MLRTGAALIVSCLHKVLEGLGHCGVRPLLSANCPHLLVNALHQDNREAWPGRKLHSTQLVSHLPACMCSQMGACVTPQKVSCEDAGSFPDSSHADSKN